MQKKIFQPNTMRADIIYEYLKRASVLYLIGAILSAVVVLGGLIFYLIYIPQDISELKEEEGKTWAEKQLEEINKLRKDMKPLTEEELQSQMDDINDLRKKEKPLTQEELQKQLEEINNLRK